MIYNINPKIWGKYFWGASHCLTFAYPENPTDDDKKTIKQYFESLQNILPCEKCRYHYKLNLTKYPLTNDVLSSRYKLIKWLVDLHNEVNVRTGKQEMTVDQTINYYSNPENQIEHYGEPIIISPIIIILLLLILIFALIYYMKKD